MTLTQVGTVIGSITAALIAIFGIIVVRGTKISEFRQRWIDEQRQDISALISHAARLSSEPNNKRAEYLIAFELAASRIRFRENPNKPEWTEVLDEIGKLRTLVNINPPRVTDISRHSESIVSLSQSRLKAEWSRVRYGELGYRIFYRLIVGIALIFATTTTLLLALYVYQYYEQVSL